MDSECSIGAIYVNELLSISDTAALNSSALADDIDLDAIDAAMVEEEAGQPDNIDMDDMKDALSEGNDVKESKE